MKYKTKAKGIVVLADGTVFYGFSAGILGTATGEICFNTGMTGYQEIFTDPSYSGQIMVCTSAHIGNYGIHEKDSESNKVHISGLICKNFSESYSRPDANGSLQSYFEENNVVAVSDVDSRAIVRNIRNKGAMNVIISSIEFDVEKLKAQLSEVPSMAGLELSSKVSTSKSYTMGDPEANHKVAIIDFGVKKAIARAMVDRGSFVKVFPMSAKVEEILRWNPDGIILSNGPGDPASMKESITKVRELTEHNTPIFGICLGHQLLALAAGIETEKMHTGHRGVNHPVKNIITGKGEVTSQNHGFVVSIESLKKNDLLELTHVHLNDDSVAGMRYKNKPIFSVQHHPEASPGPHDSMYLFDNFIEIIVENKTA